MPRGRCAPWRRRPSTVPEPPERVIAPSSSLPHESRRSWSAARRKVNTLLIRIERVTSRRRRYPDRLAPHRTRPAPVSRRQRPPRKGDLREAAILDRAWALLAEKPLSHITIEDLVSGARISRSSFYFYFESKDAVIRALAARVEGEIRDVF